MSSAAQTTSSRPDILILGAGLAGTSLAWHLAGRCRVQLVEQGERECLEASAQNAGMLRRLVASSDERRLACRTWDFLQELPSDDWGDESPFRRTGSFVAIAQPSSSEAHVLSTAARGLRTAGVDVEKVAGDDVARVAPALAGSPISHGYWIPDDGVCDPQLLGRGFVRGAESRGADVRFGVRVESLHREGDRIAGVNTNRGVMHAGQVILASAAWTPRLLRPFGLERRVRTTARHLLVTNDHPLAHEDHPWCWIEDAGIYVRAERVAGDGGQFWCSPCDEDDVLPPVGPGSSSPPTDHAIAQTHEKLARYFPALSPVEFVDGWVGLRTFGPNRNSIVGPDPDLPGLFWMTALGGSGVSTSFALGERVARALLSSTAPPDSNSQQAQR